MNNIFYSHSNFNENVLESNLAEQKRKKQAHMVAHTITPTTNAFVVPVVDNEKCFHHAIIAMGQRL